MAKKNLKSIPAQGQIDPTACWMACLSWWLKAAHNTDMRQIDIMGLFGAVWSANGTIDPAALKTVIEKNNAIFKMKIETIFPASLAYYAGGDSPTIIAFQTPGGTGHMNVLYDVTKDYKEIYAMEPWYPENLDVVHEPGQVPYVSDGKKFTGMHFKRALSYYQTALRGQNGLFVGYPK